MVSPLPADTCVCSLYQRAWSQDLTQGVSSRAGGGVGLVQVHCRCPWEGSVGEVFPLSPGWASCCSPEAVSRNCIPITPSRNLIFHTPDLHLPLSNGAFTLMIWTLWERNQCPWQCPTQLRKPSIHSLAFPLPHGRNHEPSSLALSSAGWNDASKVKLFFLPPLAHPNSFCFVLFYSNQMLEILLRKPGFSQGSLGCRWLPKSVFCRCSQTTAERVEHSQSPVGHSQTCTKA